MFPALAVADELEARGWRVSFAGTVQGPEARLAPAHGLEFHPLPAVAFRGKGAMGRIRAVARVLRSTWTARSLLRRLGIDVVVATGGYVCVPAALATAFSRRGLILVEPNASAGLANRLLSRWANAAAVAWPEVRSELRCRIRVTGVPVRRAFFSLAEPGAAPPWRILVLGGSQGAQSLNELVPSALRRLLEGGGPELRVLHQCGAGKEVATRAEYAATEVQAEVVAFIDDVPAAMAASDCVLSRAGAVTLAEICAAGRASILFPLRLAGAHQEHNARAMSQAGAAVTIEAEEMDAEHLRLHLAGVLRTERLREMGRAAVSLARPRAAAEIAELVEEAAA